MKPLYLDVGNSHDVKSDVVPLVPKDQKPLVGLLQLFYSPNWTPVEGRFPDGPVRFRKKKIIIFLFVAYLRERAYSLPLGERQRIRKQQLVVDDGFFFFFFLNRTELSFKPYCLLCQTSGYRPIVGIYQGCTTTSDSAY